MQLLVKGRGDIRGYSRQDAIELGLVGAVVWRDIVYRIEHFNVNPIWYDQKEAARRLGIDYQKLNRTVKALAEAGRIIKKRGYRPNTLISTTWITIPEEWIESCPDGKDIEEDDSIDEGSDDRNIKYNIYEMGSDEIGYSQNYDSYIKEKEKRKNRAGVLESEFRDTQSTHSPLVVYIRVNPSGRKWKSKKVYSNQEEIDKLDSVDDDERIEFKYWLSPKMVGDYDRVKHTFCKAKLIQPDVDDEEEDNSEEVSVW